MRNAIIQAKLQQLAAGHRPRLLDLFSGCGGMTLGFHREGFEPVGGVEMDGHAALSCALNFHGDIERTSPEHFEALASPRDITATSAVQLAGELKLGPVAEAVDVIVGGPPCPAFTRVGRAKLREVHDHPEAYRNDPRWQLYVPYLQYVEAFQPLALVMENVPDILNFGGYNLGQEIAETLGDMGYVARYSLANAAFFGVPQMRDRFFLVAFHKDLGITPELPFPTHRIDLPAGYRSSRSVALKHIARDLLAPEHFVEPIEPGPDALPAVTAREALADLPRLSHARRGARRLWEPIPYGVALERTSAYGKSMRTWPGFETAGQGTFVGHETRALTERDYRLFRRMPPGADYPAAHAIATALFNAEVAQLGGEGRIGAEVVEALRKEYVPPYDPTKFPNKWRKMEPDLPCRTLMAHLGKDAYTHIHYDGAQARVISVREAARLQSFPDGFRFAGRMNPAFRQVGNAVPPLMAAALAAKVREGLEIACGVSAAERVAG